MAVQLFLTLHHTGACGPSRARPFVPIGRALWIRTMKIHLGELPLMDCSSQIRIGHGVGEVELVLRVLGLLGGRDVPWSTPRLES